MRLQNTLPLQAAQLPIQMPAILILNHGPVKFQGLLAGGEKPIGLLTEKAFDQNRSILAEIETAHNPRGILRIKIHGALSVPDGQDTQIPIVDQLLHPVPVQIPQGIEHGVPIIG